MHMRFALLAALALAGCAHRAPATVKVDPALETLVPADTVLMVGTRLEALMKTPVYKNNFAGRNFSQIQDFATTTGIDPRKDLWELLFVSNGKQGVLLGRGKFADEMMEPPLERNGARPFTYKGFTLRGSESSAIVLVSSTTAALGDRARAARIYRPARNLAWSARAPRGADEADPR